MRALLWCRSTCGIGQALGRAAQLHAVPLRPLCCVWDKECWSQQFFHRDKLVHVRQVHVLARQVDLVCVCVCVCLWFSGAVSLLAKIGLNGSEILSSVFINIITAIIMKVRAANLAWVEHSARRPSAAQRSLSQREHITVQCRHRSTFRSALCSLIAHHNGWAMVRRLNTATSSTSGQSQSAKPAQHGNSKQHTYLSKILTQAPHHGHSKKSTVLLRWI